MDVHPLDHGSGLRTGGAGLLLVGALAVFRERLGGRFERGQLCRGKPLLSEERLFAGQRPRLGGLGSYVLYNRKSTFTAILTERMSVSREFHRLFRQNQANLFSKRHLDPLNPRSPFQASPLLPVSRLLHKKAPNNPSLPPSFDIDFSLAHTLDFLLQPLFPCCLFVSSLPYPYKKTDCIEQSVWFGRRNLRPGKAQWAQGVVV